MVVNVWSSDQNISIPLKYVRDANSVCCCSVAKLCPTPRDSMTAALQASLSFTISWSLLKLKSIDLVMPSNHLILCHFLLLLLQSFPASRSFLMNQLYRWSKYWSFSFSISPSNEYSGLISFRTDRFDLLVVQGAVKIILQHHSSKTSILPC